MRRDPRFDRVDGGVSSSQKGSDRSKARLSLDVVSTMAKLGAGRRTETVTIGKRRELEVA